MAELRIPDIGNAKDVTVIEIFIKAGDQIAENDPLITLEGDKASMEVPAVQGGTIESVKVKIGDKVSEGDVIAIIKTEGGQEKVEKAGAEKKQPPPASSTSAKEEKPQTQSKAEIKHEAPSKTKETQQQSTTMTHGAEQQFTRPSSEQTAAHIHAGPAVRRIARELNLDLSHITGTGPKGRVLKDDIKAYVQSTMQQGGSSGFVLPAAPDIDFSKFGEVEVQPLNKIKRATGVNLHRNWITIPHVTQFDEADITEMEAFRQTQKSIADAKGVKLTPLVFIMKAVIACLKQYPQFNSSLDSRGEQLILKKYFHLGIAVDTPNGLVVPVIRNVDQKGMFELAEELAVISKKAREKGLAPADMSGSCFTISSLGGIGGTAFTPIVNAPDVAILGVSKAQFKPVYENGQWVPRLMLPLSLSYDHRVIDGADGARFCASLANYLSDVRRLLL